MSAFGEAYRKLFPSPSVRSVADPTCTICGLPKSTHRWQGTPLRLWCPPRETEFTADTEGKQS